MQLNKLTTPYECDFLSYQPQSTSLPFRSLFRRFPPSHHCCSLLSSLPLFFIRLFYLSLSLSLSPSLFLPILCTTGDRFISLRDRASRPSPSHPVLYVILAACPSPSARSFPQATNRHTDRLQLVRCFTRPRVPFSG